MRGRPRPFPYWSPCPLPKPERREPANRRPVGTSPTRTPRPVTDRHLEILANAAQGRTNRQIGAALGISERTVRNHMREILKRLATRDRTHAVVVAIGNGWIAIPIQPDPEGSSMPATPTVTTESTA